MIYVRLDSLNCSQYILYWIMHSIRANIRLGEDVLKTSWRRLQCNIFLSSKTSWRRLEDIIARRLANTSWRRLEDVLGRRIANTSWRRLEDVLEDEKCYAEDVFKTSSRRLGKQEMFAGMMLKLKNSVSHIKVFK